MNEQGRNDIPDWLSPLYESQEGAPQQPSQEGAVQPGSVLPALAITAFQLEGEPSPELTLHLGTQKILMDNLHLSMANKAIEEARRQIADYVEQTSSLLMPENVEVYNLRQNADVLKHYPVQLATVIVDTLLLAYSEWDTCPRDIRHRAILGVAQRIIDYQKRERDQKIGSEMLTSALLMQIKAANTSTASMENKIQLLARVFFLEAVASDLPPSQRTGQIGSSWLG